MWQISPNKSRFLLQRADGRFRDPTCLVSTIHADVGGVMVCGNCSWHISDLNPESRHGRTGDSQQECAANKSAAIMWCNHGIMPPNLVGIILTSCTVQAAKHWIEIEVRFILCIIILCGQWDYIFDPPADTGNRFPFFKVVFFVIPMTFVWQVCQLMWLDRLTIDCCIIMHCLKEST